LIRKDFPNAGKHFVADLQEIAANLGAFEGFSGGNATSFPECLKHLAASGLAGIALDPDVGGQGRSFIDAILTVAMLTRSSSIAGDCLHLLNFGAVQQLARFGDASHRDAFLRPALRAEAQFSTAMTEPDAGSAATALTTQASIRGDHVVLNGTKIFILYPDTATHFLVWVNFGKRLATVGSIVVPQDAPGLTIVTNRFMSGELYGTLYFRDCEVPTTNIVLSENGFSQMLPVFNFERLGNAARSLAYAEAAFELAVNHARTRKQFDRTLGEFQGLRWRFSEMKLQISSAKLLLHAAAAAVETGTASPTDTALAKIACNRAGFNTADAALQIFGAYGYDADHPVNYMFRRTRGWLIAGGTTEQMLERVASDILPKKA
jgi:alkylation response protein AidB-like acyl-CoA dehydrogenase